MCFLHTCTILLSLGRQEDLRLCRLWHATGENSPEKESLLLRRPHFVFYLCRLGIQNWARRLEGIEKCQMFVYIMPFVYLSTPSSKVELILLGVVAVATAYVI